MNNRDYNVFFNLHTVSGIIISVGLFVCFMAGAFALFMNDINKWEVNSKRVENIYVDYERVLTHLTDTGYNMDERTIFIRLIDESIPYIMVASRPVQKKGKHSTQVAEDKNKLNPIGPISIKLDPINYSIINKLSNVSEGNIGTFLYHLHYFDQIPKIGLYLSGLVAVFFLFAIITGTIIHWDKITSNFFTFRLKGSIKNLWTDSHTALGIIGLPFQFMYAVTASMFSFLFIVLIPFSSVIFNGDNTKLLSYIAPGLSAHTATDTIQTERININKQVQQAQKTLGIRKSYMTFVNISNYNDKNARLMVSFRENKESAFLDDAYITYQLSNGKIIDQKNHGQNNYTNGAVLNTIRKLHFAQFGGYFIKTIYFLLAMVTCYVILSGVMIWLEARNKKAYEKDKKFNRNVGAIYIGTCIGLLPAIALYFCITKILPLDIENRYNIINTIFFIFWLVYIIYAYISKDLFKINKHALLITGAMGIMIPFLNGIQSGLWFWKSWQAKYYESFFTDISWILLGIALIIIAFPLQRLVSIKEKATTTTI